MSAGPYTQDIVLHCKSDFIKIINIKFIVWSFFLQCGSQDESFFIKTVSTGLMVGNCTGAHGADKKQNTQVGAEGVSTMGITCISIKRLILYLYFKSSGTHGSLASLLYMQAIIIAFLVLPLQDGGHFCRFLSMAS